MAISSDQTVPRPAMCPHCHGTKFDTLAKVVTVMSLWRCRECEGTWTIASQDGASVRVR